MVDIIQAHLAQLQEDPNFAESLMFPESIRHVNASPFFEAIQAAPVPERFTILHFKFYADTTYLVLNIKYDHEVMLIYQQNDAFLCKIFFASLDEESIANFLQ